MKITDVRLVVFERPSNDVRIKGQSILKLLTQSTAVQIITDEGPTGESVSLGGGLGMAHYIASTVRPVLIGADPARREAIWQELWSLNRLWWTPQFTIGAVDVALWDLYGRIVSQPVYQLLGGYRQALPAYASAMTHPRAEDFIREALECKERGYHGYKMHVWGDVKRDIELCTAVRAAVGNDWHLMIDIVSGYTQTEALKVGRALEELQYFWYEEPLRDYDWHGYRMLCAALDIPIAAMEANEGSVFSTAEPMSSRAVDFVRTDVAFKEGITPVMKTAAAAEALGMNIEIHTVPASPLMEVANLHCGLAVKNTTFYEHHMPTETFRFGLQSYIDVDSEGLARVPEGPGLGARIDWEYVNRYKVAEI